MIYRDRAHAGNILAELLDEYKDQDACVLGIPRGGMVVAAQVARKLNLPLDALLARKLGVPGNEELIFGAVGPGEVVYIDQKIAEQMDLDQDQVDRVLELERRDFDKRLARYRDGEEPVDVAGRVAIIVDDGITTGATMRAAIQAVDALKPSQVILATPLGAPDVMLELERMVHQALCPTQADSLNALSQWYQQFDPVGDDQVVELMREYGPQRTARQQ